MNSFWMFHGIWTKKMVVWKDCEHNIDDPHVANESYDCKGLRECELLKYFRVSGMRAHIHLLDHLIWMWDPDQHHFQVGTHILNIDVEDIYFLTRLSQRGSPISLTGCRRGEMFLDDPINEYCVNGARSQGGKIPIKHIVDRPLSTLAFTIEKVADIRDKNKTTQEHMLYALEWMAKTIFNWSEGSLVSLKDYLTKCI